MRNKILWLIYCYKQYHYPKYKWSIRRIAQAKQFWTRTTENINIVEVVTAT